jgi:hypothetical protein
VLLVTGRHDRLPSLPLAREGSSSAGRDHHSGRTSFEKSVWQADSPVKAFSVHVLPDCLLARHFVPSERTVYAGL